ncbi:Hsp20/alpha crystallin family protein [Planctomicrobium piriforme]|uniref:HSP20 family protein n=1 Tax=Planctomicrobium piriforme TaxID=1576369 RepID=A0A1I3ARQ2_9PLAN|nr:Hsp20/alpha crystallin family protein [Planctomicrobium piriforme]SFH52703.1 HSP20 family protein [Planctomicrobium piriforme]
MNPSTPKERSIKNWLPPTSFGALRQEVNDLVENLLGDSMPNFRGDQVPRVDVSETADFVEVVADVPGFKTEEVSVDLADNHLILTGQHPEQPTASTEARRFHRIERRMSSFTRSVLLPCPVDDTRVEAELKDGILSVRLPKREDVRRRRVPIRGAESTGTVTDPGVNF